jgi:hypothetical protein
VIDCDMKRKSGVIRVPKLTLSFLPIRITGNNRVFNHPAQMEQTFS